MQEMYRNWSDHGSARFSNTDHKSYACKENRFQEPTYSQRLEPNTETTETRSAKNDSEHTNACVIIDTTEFSIIERSKLQTKMCCGWLLQLLVLGLFLGIYMNIAVPNRGVDKPVLIVVNTGVSSPHGQMFRDINNGQVLPGNGGELLFLSSSDFDRPYVASENLYHSVPLSETYIKMQVHEEWIPEFLSRFSIHSLIFQWLFWELNDIQSKCMMLL